MLISGLKGLRAFIPALHVQSKLPKRKQDPFSTPRLYFKSIAL